MRADSCAQAPLLGAQTAAATLSSSPTLGVVDAMEEQEEMEEQEVATAEEAPAAATVAVQDQASRTEMACRVTAPAS